VAGAFFFLAGADGPADPPAGGTAPGGRGARFFLAGGVEGAPGASVPSAVGRAARLRASDGGAAFFFRFFAGDGPAPAARSGPAGRPAAGGRAPAFFAGRAPAVPVRSDPGAFEAVLALDTVLAGDPVAALLAFDALLALDPWPGPAPERWAGPSSAGFGCEGRRGAPGRAGSPERFWAEAAGRPGGRFRGPGRGGCSPSPGMRRQV
jgi:hypothetical protein